MSTGKSSEPLMSADGHEIQGVVFYDTRTRTTRTVKPSDLTEEERSIFEKNQQERAAAMAHSATTQSSNADTLALLLDRIRIVEAQQASSAASTATSSRRRKPKKITGKDDADTIGEGSRSGA